MHKQLPVTVLEAFDLAGVHYTPGQSAQLPTVDALILRRKKLVQVTKPGARISTAALEPEPDETPKRKRTYKRRDMQAEETAAVETPSFDAEHDVKREASNPTPDPIPEPPAAPSPDRDPGTKC